VTIPRQLLTQRLADVSGANDHDVHRANSPQR
jgi:hypothetical protein